MDKRKVIAAYRRGFINIQECAQILGIESVQIKGMINDPQFADIPIGFKKHSANG
ncbi:hypothetical protein [Paenibacillus selenitireducens]|jgi:hypothetical protein|uniref:hypothetical protein n=1 Tax=Paenibacillus selenitireducens TaxID=1324314 RepID=UPI0018E972F7|nr:hypothetical protein [Paenibacillus selenitireducens]